MRRIIEYLSRTKTLLFLLVLLVLIGAGFGSTSTLIGGRPLDMMLTQSDNLTRYMAMDAAERNAHLWVTLTLDTLYPLAYGGALAGIAAHFLAGRLQFIAAIPALLLILVDIGENMLIAQVLMGHESALAAKVIATQLKWLLFAVATLIALGACLGAIVRQYVGGRSVEES